MSGTYFTSAAVERLRSQLSDRDQKIVADLGSLRALTGAQAARLHFSDLGASARDRTRRRVLARLCELGLVTTLDRRIGGVRAGSAGLVYTLGSGGQRLLARTPTNQLTGSTSRARRPTTPGLLFLTHTLAISELYVQLREQERVGTLGLVRFAAEPAAWMPNGANGLIKPDASLLVSNRGIEDSWVVEVDRATEALPTLRRKLLTYVDFANTGQLGADGVMPRLLIAVAADNPDATRQRLGAVCRLVEGLPAPATAFMYVVDFMQVIAQVIATLNE